MSVYATIFVWETSGEKSTALLTMLAIADYADEETGEAFPGIAKLAEKLRMKERNVQTLLRKLEDDKEIIIHENKGVTTPSGRTNRYTLVGYKEWYQGVQKLGNKKRKGVQDSVSRGASLRNQGVQDSAPNPSVEPSEEHTSQKSDGQSSAPKIPKEQLDTEYDTVSLVWKTQASGFIVNVQGMLFGTKKVKGDWNKCKMNPLATVQEVIAFADYAQGRMTRHRLDAIPTAPDTIQRWFCDFRMEREKNDRHKSQSQNNGYNSMAMNAAMFAEGRES